MNVRRSIPWQRLATWSVAAGLVLGVGLQLAQRRSQRRIDALFGPPALPSAVAEMARHVESVAGPEGARWVGEQLATATAARSRMRRAFDAPEQAWPAVDPALYQLSSVR